MVQKIGQVMAIQAVSDEHSKQLAAMADTWDKLAAEREASTRNEASPFPNEASPFPPIHASILTGRATH